MSARRRIEVVVLDDAVVERALAAGRLHRLSELPPVQPDPSAVRAIYARMAWRDEQRARRERALERQRGRASR